MMKHQSLATLNVIVLIINWRYTNVQLQLNVSDLGYFNQ